MAASSSASSSSSGAGAGAGGYAPYHRRNNHSRTLSNTTVSQMGTYRSSPLAQQSGSGSGAGATGLPASSSLTSLFLPQNDYHTASAASSSPSSRAMSPLPPLPSDRASTPLAFVANNSRSRPYSPSVDTIDTPPPPPPPPHSNNRLPTFQPKGLAVNRTAEFIAHRKRKQDNGRLEDGRLARRLEKVLAIHHNPVPLPAPSSSSSKFLDSSSSSAAVGEGYDSAEEPLLAFASNTASTLRKASSNLWATLRAASAVHNSSSDHPASSSGFLSTLEAARNKAAQDAARRTAEQSIVKWQADADARACPICSSPFSLAVRKHHCRLCGRVVCASPQLTAPIFPTTATTNGINGAGGPTTSSTALVDPVKAASLLAEQKCSGLIVLTDARTGKVDDARKVAAEAAVGAASVAEMSAGAGGGGGGGGRGVGEVALRNLESHVEERAIRVCKDCRKVIFRQQYMLESGPTPTWLKLYEALIRLQREIEESLPEFHEMVLGLQKHDISTTLGSSARATVKLQRDAAQARKQLLANFTAYDALAKRIRSLPTPTSLARAAAAASAAAAAAGGKTSEAVDDPQERVQLAIWTNANLFLQKNMFPLQTLPKTDSSTRRPQSGSHNRTPSSTSSSTSQQQTQDQVLVLREQQHLLEDYMARANAARKFEDARMLRMSWEEIEREVRRLVGGAGGGGVGDPRRAGGRRGEDG